MLSVTEPICTEENNQTGSSTKDAPQQRNVTESTVVQSDSSSDQNQTPTTTMVSLVTPNWFHLHAHLTFPSCLSYHLVAVCPCPLPPPPTPTPSGGM